MPGMASTLIGDLGCLHGLTHSSCIDGPPSRLADKCGAAPLSGAMYTHDSSRYSLSNHTSSLSDYLKFIPLPNELLDYEVILHTISRELTCVRGQHKTLIPLWPSAVLSFSSCSRDQPSLCHRSTERGAAPFCLSVSFPSRWNGSGHCPLSHPEC